MVYKRDHAPRITRLTPGELASEETDHKDRDGA
jgi:hypothetical protein